ncbi:PREDICTED: uncharacterized protein LOC108560589 [Nicrophorus vespilloides]|uniref:Uncharacterized protein LOC108560589 n=1 Tax=Nicrophorus vespilloides TaxID=110193 RepID=A0ABM1MGK1_NICVS|nr:PREDICTED: uncharacterized protein LOC108560589 [Nicrophorus vespilloides]
MAQSAMLYAAPVWEEAMTVKSYRRLLETVQRKCAIRICIAWQTSEKGAWTRRLIPEMKPWINRNHGEVTFHLTQALSGHGCFSKYLNFIAKKEDEKCWYCEDNDSPEHTLFSCCRWAAKKHVTEANLGVVLTPQNFVSKLLKSSDKWNVIARHVLYTKEEDQRRMERENEENGSGS